MAQPQGGDIGAHVLVCERVGHEDLLPEPVDLSDQLTVSDVCKEDVELQVVDLYAVRTESDKTQKKGTKPFIHQVKLHGPKGEVVWVWGLFDNGAMVDAMSTETYNRVRHRLTPLGRSSRRLRMANGNIVNPVGCWKGVVELGGATVEGSFEVFDSGGGWDFLFGKTLMTAFEAVHDYAVDEVFIPRQQLTLQNQHNIAIQRQLGAGHKYQTESEQKMRETKEGDKAQSPVRGVPTNHVNQELRVIDAHTPATAPLNTEPQERMLAVGTLEEPEQETIAGDEMTSPPREVPAIETTEDETHANGSTSHRSSVEEVEDEDSREYKAKEDENKTSEASKERLKRQQNVKEEERQYH